MTTLAMTRACPMRRRAAIDGAFTPMRAGFVLMDCVSRLRQLLDVVHQVVQLPLPVDLAPASQAEAVQPPVRLLCSGAGSMPFRIST